MPLAPNGESSPLPSSLSPLAFFSFSKSKGRLAKQVKDARKQLPKQREGKYFFPLFLEYFNNGNYLDPDNDGLGIQLYKLYINYIP